MPSHRPTVTPPQSPNFSLYFFHTTKRPVRVTSWYELERHPLFGSRRRATSPPTCPPRSSAEGRGGEARGLEAHHHPDGQAPERRPREVRTDRVRRGAAGGPPARRRPTGRGRGDGGRGAACPAVGPAINGRKRPRRPQPGPIRFRPEEPGTGRGRGWQRPPCPASRRWALAPTLCGPRTVGAAPRRTPGSHFTGSQRADPAWIQRVAMSLQVSLSQQVVYSGRIAWTLSSPWMPPGSNHPDAHAYAHADPYAYAHPRPWRKNPAIWLDNTPCSAMLWASHRRI